MKEYSSECILLKRVWCEKVKEEAERKISFALARKGVKDVKYEVEFNEAFLDDRGFVEDPTPHYIIKGSGKAEGEPSYFDLNTSTTEAVNVTGTR